MSPGDPSAVDTDRLWLEALGRITSRAAHDVKGALNGVSVNLEVVRSRTERADATAVSVHRFAESASQQLEVLIRMNDALLTLARPVRGPVDVGSILVKMAVLLRRSAAVEGGSLEVDENVSSSDSTTNAHGNAVRLALGTALLAALDQKAATTCRLDRSGNEIRVHVTSSAGGVLSMPSAITDALASSGIRMDVGSGSCSLTFPRAGLATETPGADNA
jgi:signal transduction histidine kinase